jgi:hypothetical protein
VLVLAAVGIDVEFIRGGVAEGSSPPAVGVGLCEGPGSLLTEDGSGCSVVVCCGSSPGLSTADAVLLVCVL